MAHTDRDDDRWYWREHHRNDCVNSWRTRRYGEPERRCEVCNAEPTQQPWWHNNGKQHWNRQQRQAERGKARQALREARDYDDLVIDYRRPYWD